MFIKMKVDKFAIKRRGCAAGRKQWIWLSKEETSFPTISTGGLMMPCVIDAMEVKDLSTVEITGALIKTD